MSEVPACPKCDASNPYRRRPSVQGFDHAHRYRCEECDHRFDTPITRKGSSSTNIPGHSLAAKLDAMDADEVGR